MSATALAGTRCSPSNGSRGSQLVTALADSTTSATSLYIAIQGQPLPLLCRFTGSYAAVDLAAQLSPCVTVQEHGGNLTADAIELQLKDNHNQMVPALSFNGSGREMTVSDYGLIPGPRGTQHHIWAIFIDDTAAKIQREATARILQPTGKHEAKWHCMQIYLATSS